MSHASYNPTTVHPIVMTTLRLLQRIGLVHIEVTVVTDLVALVVLLLGDHQWGRRENQ